MARPTTTRRTVRVQTNERPQSPSLGVYAPLSVKTPGAETDPLHGLSQVLGVVGTVGSAVVKEKGDHEYAQGQADEKIGKADMERAKKSRRYADGAYEIATLEQYQEVEQKVATRAASDELDKSMSVDAQVAVIDGWMKSELGPIVTDDRAKRLVATRYQGFIEKFGGNVAQAQIEAHATAALEVTQSDIVSQVERTGSFNWGEQWDRLHSQIGDGTKATEALVGIVGQEMVEAAKRGEDPKKYRALIPSEIVGADGKTLPGPLYSPKHRDTIARAEAAAEDAFDNYMKPKVAAREFEYTVQLDDMLNKDVPITKDTFANLGIAVGDGAQDDFHQNKAAQYIQESERRRAAKLEKQAEDASYLEARRRHGRWVDTTGVPGGPDSVEKTQKAFEQDSQQVLTGMGVSPEALGGTGLISDPQVLDWVTRLSAQEGMAYGPLKRTMSEVNPAAPGDLTSRIAAYKVLKAKNLLGMYLDDDAALMYEVAIGAEAAGETKEGITKRVMTMGDKDTREYVAYSMKSVDVRKTGFDLPTGNGFLGTGDVKSTKLMNGPAIASRYESLVASALTKGLPVDQAKAYAEQRIRDTHVAIAIGDTYAALPKSAVIDPKVTTEALDWYVDQLPAIAEKLKIPGESLSILPRVGINGRELRFEIVREGGVEIPGRDFSLDGLLMAYRRNNPQADKRGEAERQSELLRQNRIREKANPADLTPSARAGRE